jgi:hypothetical protein
MGTLFLILLILNAYFFLASRVKVSEDCLEAIDAEDWPEAIDAENFHG